MLLDNEDSSWSWPSLFTSEDIDTTLHYTTVRQTFQDATYRTFAVGDVVIISQDGLDRPADAAAALHPDRVNLAQIVDMFAPLAEEPPPQPMLIYRWFYSRYGCDEREDSATIDAARAKVARRERHDVPIEVDDFFFSDFVDANAPNSVMTILGRAWLAESKAEELDMRRRVVTQKIRTAQVVKRGRGGELVATANDRVYLSRWFHDTSAKEGEQAYRWLPEGALKVLLDRPTVARESFEGAMERVRTIWDEEREKTTMAMMGGDPSPRDVRVPVRTKSQSFFAKGFRPFSLAARECDVQRSRTKPGALSQRRIGGSSQSSSAAAFKNSSGAGPSRSAREAMIASKKHSAATSGRRETLGGIKPVGTDKLPSASTPHRYGKPPFGRGLSSRRSPSPSGGSRVDKKAFRSPKEADSDYDSDSPDARRIPRLKSKKNADSGSEKRGSASQSWLLNEGRIKKVARGFASSQDPPERNNASGDKRKYQSNASWEKKKILKSNVAPDGGNASRPKPSMQKFTTPKMEVEHNAPTPSKSANRVADVSASNMVENASSAPREFPGDRPTTRADLAYPTIPVDSADNAVYDSMFENCIVPFAQAGGSKNLDLFQDEMAKVAAAFEECVVDYESFQDIRLDPKALKAMLFAKLGEMN